MPKRIVDGEGLWRSDKLALVTPTWIKAEYANLVPLARANGSFECNPQLVWSQVYAYNRTEMNVKKVVEILDELERVRLLFRWEEGGKQWGYFTGINRPGRLPPPSRQNHYPVGANPPFERIKEFLLTNSYPKASQRLLDGYIGIGIGLGSGIGIGSTPNGVVAPPDEAVLASQNAAIFLPLNDSTEFPIYDSQISQLISLFPAVDVKQQLNNMRAWCLTNPTRRKTKTGILRFVTSWLAKEQNRGRPNDNDSRSRKSNIIDQIRNNRRMPDFG